MVVVAWVMVVQGQGANPDLDSEVTCCMCSANDPTVTTTLGTSSYRP